MLPFPDKFNVTIVENRHLTECDGVPVCHRVNIREGCSVFVCHVNEDSKATVVKVQHAKVGVVEMLMNCHYATNNVNDGPVTLKLLHKKPGAPICHFNDVNTFFLCRA